MVATGVIVAKGGWAVKRTACRSARTSACIA